MKLGLIQICGSNNVEHNLNKIEPLLRQAAEQGAQLVLLPENFALMPNHSAEKLANQERQGQGKVQAWLSRVSAELNIWIVAGSFPIQSDDIKRPYARCLIYNSQGQLDSYYDKIHLFDVAVSEQEQYLESADTQAGEQPQIIEVAGLKIGISICYDLRFPELYRYFQSQGVELALVPSAFTYKTGQAHWELLLKTRAVENLFFVAAANQTGIHANGRQTYGHSLAIDPWGKVLASLEAEEGLLVVNIEQSKLATIRRRFPAHLHRKI
ncbi:carbon-nitrogen hydrolase family protein [Kangiella sp. TOML190]|uniref:carbon-nitrogen hydrolase family protein n=1 Tax=Kangiella sp. TOML190 TaxID=2931351 RepID=UPI0020410B31|nr:carbon-nitrogen hydrolase family protein [Kangiella sp. TOML190]